VLRRGSRGSGWERSRCAVAAGRMCVGIVCEVYRAPLNFRVESWMWSEACLSAGDDDDAEPSLPMNE
jgi:hypothetical protein